MRLKIRSFFGAVGALFVALAVLAATCAPDIGESMTRDMALRRSALMHIAADRTRLLAARLDEFAVAFPCYLHSLTPFGRPIDRASQHVSSEFTVDEDRLRRIPTSGTEMALNFLDTARASTLAFAVGFIVAGCGGGGAEGGATSAINTASAGSSSTSSLVGDGSVTQAAISAGTATAMSVSLTSAVISTSGAVLTTAKKAKASSLSSLGLNLGGLSYYSPSLPVIDLMKKSSGWLTQCNPYAPGSNTCNNFTGGAGNWDTLEESALDLDADGWVRSLPASTDPKVKYRSVATLLMANGWQQAGQYIVRYDGSGTLAYFGATKDASQSSVGRDVVNVSSGILNIALLITATNPSNYLRNIRVYPPGGACSSDLTTYAASASACTGATGTFVAFENFPAGSIWHPALLTELKGMRTARFMDWQSTNSSLVTDWSQRTTATARTWASSAGVPIEQIIGLANAANIDPWVNVPTHASDDYVVHFGQALHQQLAANLVVNLEYSNEPWNYAFPASHWMYDQAQSAWPAGVVGNTDSYTLQTNWYANQLVHVCNLVKAQFGVDKARVRCVANAQAANSYSASIVLACPVAAKTLGHPCANAIDVLSVAPYFGGYITDPSFRPTVSSWYTQADGGLTQLFNEIMGTEGAVAVTAPLANVGSGAPNGALAQIRSWMVANKAVADKYGIPMWAYEGGQSLTPPTGDTDTTLLNLLITANRDPRMGAAYTQMLSDWKVAGGQTFALYDDVATPSQYGMWGLKETQFDTSAAKWTAVAKFRDSVACWWSGC